jgi:hypothetical protein
VLRDRPAIVLQVQHIARHPKRLGKASHNLDQVIECIGKFFRVRPIAVTELRVIGRDKVVAMADTPASC